MKHPRLSAIFIAASAATLVMASTASFAGHKASHKAAPAQESYKAENFKAEVPAPCPPVMMLHDGFYIGVGVGYDAYRIHQTNDFYASDLTTNPVDTFQFHGQSLNHSATGWMGGLFAGYGRYFDTFYIGAEINANGSNADTTWTATDFVDGYYSVNMKARASYGVALLPGIKLNDSSLLYVRLGYLRSQFKVNETINPFTTGTVLTASSNDWRNGFNYGVGIETYAAENVSIRGEFTHTQFNNQSVSETLVSNPATSSITNASKFEPSNNEFMLSLLYHFA